MAITTEQFNELAAFIVEAKAELLEKRLDSYGNYTADDYREQLGWNDETT